MQILLLIAIVLVWWLVSRHQDHVLRDDILRVSSNLDQAIGKLKRIERMVPAKTKRTQVIFDVQDALAAYENYFGRLEVESLYQRRLLSTLGLVKSVRTKRTSMQTYLKVYQPIDLRSSGQDAIFIGFAAHESLQQEKRVIASDKMREAMDYFTEIAASDSRIVH